MDILNEPSSVQPTNQPTTVQPPTINPKSSLHPKALLITFALFLIFLVSLTAILLGSTTKPASPPPPSPISQPSPTPDPTVNWNMFTSKYGYILKYPHEWAVKTSSWTEGIWQYALQPDDEAIINFLEPNQPPRASFPYGVSISLKIPKDNLQNLSIKEWLVKNYPQRTFTIYNITIDNIEAAIALEGDMRDTWAIIPYKSKIYQLINAPITVKDVPVENYQNLYDYDSVFGQILSTFKFLDNSSNEQEYNLETVELAKKALANDHNIPPNSIETVILEKVTWPDTCLGLTSQSNCGVKVNISGYKVTFKANNKLYFYHTGGEFFRFAGSE